ncbi:MAG: hypothetical protein ACTSYD_02410 [Candidatus Heimdallarchaeaceae archaeon]
MKSVKVRSYYKKIRKKSPKRKFRKKSFETAYRKHKDDVTVQLKDGRVGYVTYEQLDPVYESLEFIDVYGNYSIIKRDDIKLIIG